MSTTSRPWARAAAALAMSTFATVAWGQALPACTPITFESGTTEGFATTGLWHVSTACGANAGAHSTPNVLYYGIDNQCNFDTGVPNAGTADSPPMSTPGTAQLLFNSRLNSEGGDPFDMAFVQYSLDGGGSWLPLIGGNELPRSNAWEAIARDVPAHSVTAIQIRFGFDTVDAVGNGNLGWMVDDIRLCRAVSAPVPASQPGTLALLAALLSIAALAALRTRRR